MYPFAGLPENLAAFCAVLRREHGFRTGPGELEAAARALEVVPLGDVHAVRHALRPILSSTVDDTLVFDRAFTAFFFPGPRGVPQENLPPASRTGAAASGAPAEPPERRRARRAGPPSLDEPIDIGSSPSGAPESGEPATDEAAVRARSSYSPVAGTDVAPDVTRASDGWRDAARELSRRLQLGLSRRWRPARRGRRFDLRRTLRASLQTGGEPLAARWLRRPRHTPRFVLLVDGSRSMSARTEPALQLAVAIAGITRRIEVFTFSTALRRVTREVRRAVEEGAGRLEGLHHAWGGGTSIGACLAEFLRRHGERLLGRDTAVIVVSDGLDVGDPLALGHAMRELHRRSAGVIWLNPLLDTPGYAPTASGMLAARPYVTTFAAVNDLDGFRRLVRSVRLRR
jgi:uncharacterized protein with von Willebrand factor type A (vWA) domain